MKKILVKFRYGESLLLPIEVLPIIDQISVVEDDYCYPDHKDESGQANYDKYLFVKGGVVDFSIIDDSEIEPCKRPKAEPKKNEAPAPAKAKPEATALPLTNDNPTISPHAMPDLRSLVDEYRDGESSERGGQ